MVGSRDTLDILRMDTCSPDMADVEVVEDANHVSMVRV